MRRERGQHLVLAGHVVRGRQHVPERRPAQHPLVRAVADRVREVRATARDERRRAAAPPVAPVDVRGEPRSQSFEVDPGRRVGHGREVTDPTSDAAEARSRRLRRCGTRGRDGLAVAARVAGDPTDGHVDAESRGGALLFGLAAPEAVLAVLAGPVAALLQRRARPAHRAGLRLAHDARLGALAGRREEQARLTLARGLGGPRQRAGEDEAGHHFGGHVLPFTTERHDGAREPGGGTPAPRAPVVHLLVKPITRPSVKGV